MARRCEVCGKGPATGNTRSHSRAPTRRRFMPNIQVVRTSAGRVRVCTRCLKAGKVAR